MDPLWMPQSQGTPIVGKYYNYGRTSRRHCFVIFMDSNLKPAISEEALMALVYIDKWLLLSVLIPLMLSSWKNGNFVLTKS